MPSVPLLDLRAQLEQIREPVSAAIHRVVESQRFVLGPEGDGLEQELSQYIGCKHTIGCSSGTDAILLALLGLEIGPGDEVVTTPYTFFATAGSIVRTGAIPVFVDIDPDTYNLDCAQLEAAITSKTRAIMPVHLYGQPVEMGPIYSAAATHGLTIIEDACQAIGARYHGKSAGNLGKAACFSFFPTKNLGGYGEGGAITTNDDKLAARLKNLRVHGMEPKYYHQRVGINGRLDEIQAAVLRVKLQYLDGWIQKRQENAELYNQLFEAHSLNNCVKVPQTIRGVEHVYHQYVIGVDSQHRDRLRKHLSEKGIGSEIYYPVPVHLQECFANMGYRVGDLPVSERAARSTIALPIYAELTATQQQCIVEEIGRYFETADLSDAA